MRVKLYNCVTNLDGRFKISWKSIRCINHYWKRAWKGNISFHLFNIHTFNIIKLLLGYVQFQLVTINDIWFHDFYDSLIDSIHISYKKDQTVSVYQNRQHCYQQDKIKC